MSRVAIETMYTLLATLSCDQVCTDVQLLLSFVAVDTAVRPLVSCEFVGLEDVLLVAAATGSATNVTRHGARSDAVVIFSMLMRPTGERVFRAHV